MLVRMFDCDLRIMFDYILGLLKLICDILYFGVFLFVRNVNIGLLFVMYWYWVLRLLINLVKDSIEFEFFNKIKFLVSVEML